jgi:hypothetical protein
MANLSKRSPTELTHNTHRIEVESDSARVSMSIENIPSENPKTGLITALSDIAHLRKQRAYLRVGTWQSEMDCRRIRLDAQRSAWRS